MKKLVSLIMAVSVTAVSLCACSSRGYSLVINGINVDREIYNYYLSVSEDNSVYSDSSGKTETVVELCKKYIAGNELIDKYKISLTAEEKVTVSGKAKATWLYFKDFYNNHSVSKQTLVHMLEYEQLEDDIAVRLYSEGGERALPQEKIREYYDANYIPAQIISADLTDEMPADEITEKFTNMRNLVRQGESMETAAQKYPELAEYEGGASIVCSFDTSYPEGLFEKLSALNKGETQVFRYSNIIYLIHRLDESADETYFPLYTKECIIGMEKSEIEKMINTLAESYKTVYNIK